VQVRWSWTAAVLSAALLGAGCSKSKEQPAAPAPVASPDKAEAAAAPSAETPPAAEAEAPSGEAAAKAAAPDDGTPPEFKVGQTRDEVMERFGNCAVRRVFLPAGPGSLYVEIYQPKNDEACLKRLGERRFTIRGGTLYEIVPGLIPPDPPPHEKPEGI
jgi:hypothetical protein